MDYLVGWFDPILKYFKFFLDVIIHQWHIFQAFLHHTFSNTLSTSTVEWIKWQKFSFAIRVNILPTYMAMF